MQLQHRHDPVNERIIESESEREREREREGD
jgi:hypothetical protein